MRPAPQSRWPGWFSCFKPCDGATVEAFFNGLLHPLLVPAHTMTLAGLGVLLGRQAAVTRRVALAVLVVGLVGGVAVLAAGVGNLHADVLVGAIAMISGLLVASAMPLALPVAAALAAASGAAVALDSPPDVVSLAAAYGTLAGTGFGATAIVTLVAAGTATLHRWWQIVALRIVGSWIAAAAMLSLALRLTG